MDRATMRAVVIRIVVVAATLVAMLLVALIKGTGNAEAAIDLDRAQHAAVAAVMAGVEPTAVTTIGYEEVVDPASGCAYLAQTARLFLADASAPVTGTCEYGSVPAAAVAGFHRSLGVTAGDWADTRSSRVIMLLWHAEQGAFGAGARAGFGATVAGDTLAVLLEPTTGLETRAVVTYDDTSSLRDQATHVRTSALTAGV